MTFEQQIAASFIGTFLGFIFAIVLFVITNFISRTITNNTLKKHLKREFAYNINLLQDLMGEIDGILRKVSIDDMAVYNYLRYSFIQRYFIQESFKAGILYNLLDNEEISTLNALLLSCDIGGEQLVNSWIIKWKEGKIEKKEMLANFEFQKVELDRYKKYLEKINQNLP